MIANYLIWGFAGVFLVLALVFTIVGLRRRLERGHPARFSIGISLVDVIEGLSGKELSPKTQGAILFWGVSIGLLFAIAAIAFVLTSQGGA
jgi:hypothetical protein